MKAYLDASVIVALLTGESPATAIALWLDDAAESLLMSDFGRGEFAAAVGGKVRGGSIARSQLPILMVALDAWAASKIVLATAPEDVATATDYLLRADLPLRLPDAIHIAHAARAGATLVTLDRQQLQAAQALGIDAVDPVSGRHAPRS